MNEAQLRQALNVSSVDLLNDLQAIASAIAALEPADLHTLNEGHREPGGTIAVIAPGTGLGEGFLTWDGSRYRAYASEGGHADFAPNNAFEIELLRFLQGRLDHVSCERVCSGLGIPNVYAYLKESGIAQEPAWLAERLAMAQDPTPVIVEAALDGEVHCQLCLDTVEAFVSILGGEAGNLALKVLATGGVYLGGGIPPRILSLLEGKRFMRSFRHKGRLSGLLAEVPVHVILNPEAALLGAACHGLQASD
jgi:glucokinase